MGAWRVSPMAAKGLRYDARMRSRPGGNGGSPERGAPSAALGRGEERDGPLTQCKAPGWRDESL